MNDLQKAKELLTEENDTLVLLCGDEIITSKERGIKPLLNLYDSGKSLCGFSAADKVVGKAAAMLYILLTIKALHATVISRGAAEILSSHGVAFTYDILAEKIINRSGTGFCPMESAVEAIDDPAEAPEAIRKKLQELSKQSL